MSIAPPNQTAAPVADDTTTIGMDNRVHPMNLNGRRVRCDSIVDFDVKKQKVSSRPIGNSLEPNSGWYNNFCNEPPSFVKHDVNCAEMTREASLRAMYLIRATPRQSQPPSQPQSQRFVASLTNMTPSSLSLHHQPASSYPTTMQQRRHVATLLSAAAVVQDGGESRGSRSNSHDSNDSWTMQHNNQSFQNNASHEYSDTYMALQARKRQQAPTHSMNTSPMHHTTMTMSHHSPVPMGQFHALIPGPRPLQPSFYTPHDEYHTNTSLERGLLNSCSIGPAFRAPFMEPPHGDMLGHDSIHTRHTMTQGLPAILASQGDGSVLSPHQVFLRLQIEIFTASVDDTTTHMRGRNKPIQLHQVGIRCRYCTHVPILQRQRGHAYYPATLLGLYQAAQNMSTNHMQCGLCRHMPAAVKQRFADLIPSKNTNSGCGRTYWADTARREFGLIDTDHGIFVGRDQNDV